MPGYEFDNQEELEWRNDKSRPHFHIRTMEHIEASEKAGHPVFRDLEYVKIFSPGNQREIPDFRVKEKHIRRWPEHYKAFKAGLEAPAEGYPLTEWSVMPRALAETLKAVHIRSLEDLVAATDDDLRRMGPQIINLKYKAQKFLEDHGSEKAQIAELKEVNADLLARLEKLEAQNSEDTPEPEPDAEPETQPEPKPKPKTKAKASSAK